MSVYLIKMVMWPNPPRSSRHLSLDQLGMAHGSYSTEDSSAWEPAIRCSLWVKQGLKPCPSHHHRDVGSMPSIPRHGWSKWHYPQTRGFDTESTDSHAPFSLPQMEGPVFRHHKWLAIGPASHGNLWQSGSQENNALSCHEAEGSSKYWMWTVVNRWYHKSYPKTYSWPMPQTQKSFAKIVDSPNIEGKENTLYFKIFSCRFFGK